MNALTLRFLVVGLTLSVASLNASEADSSTDRVIEMKATKTTTTRYRPAPPPSLIKTAVKTSGYPLDPWDNAWTHRNRLKLNHGSRGLRLRSKPFLELRPVM